MESSYINMSMSILFERKLNPNALEILIYIKTPMPICNPHYISRPISILIAGKLNPDTFTYMCETLLEIN